MLDGHFGLSIFRSLAIFCFVAPVLFKKKATNLSMSINPQKFIEQARQVFETNEKLKLQKSALGAYNQHLMKVDCLCPAVSS